LIIDIPKIVQIPIVKEMEMANFLLIEDDNTVAREKQRNLERLGHQVYWAHAPSDAGRFDSARIILQEKDIDALFLDIALEERFSGIFLYNRLAAAYRELWKHTFIWSKYTNSQLREMHHGDYEFPIRVFVDTAQIPDENLFRSSSNIDLEILKKRLVDLGLQ
jgi:CheY-like chemotaxis protein